MNGVPTYIVVIIGFFLLTLMGMGVMFIWAPNEIDQAFAIKIIASFAILLIGSVMLSVVSKMMKSRSDTKKSQP